MLLAILASCDAVRDPSQPPTNPTADAANLPLCTCHLKSWIVIGEARHLFIEIETPPEYAHLAGRVEFTNTTLRADYLHPEDRPRWRRSAAALAPGLIGKMSRGHHLGPILRPPDGDIGERTEATWPITPAQALILQRDRVWNASYILLGPNSNTAARAALESIDLELPESLIAEAREGRFPGLLMSLDEALPSEDWARHGLPRGPEPDPTPTPNPSP